MLFLLLLFLPYIFCCFDSAILAPRLVLAFCLLYSIVMAWAFANSVCFAVFAQLILCGFFAGLVCCFFCGAGAEILSVLLLGV